MTPFSRRTPLFTLVCALVQLLLPGALSVSDGAAASRGRGTPDHVEATGGQPCRAPHGDECAVCRHLSSGAMRQESSPAPDVPPSSAPAAWSEGGLRSLSNRALRSRAPPESLI